MLKKGRQDRSSDKQAGGGHIFKTYLLRILSLIVAASWKQDQVWSI